MIYLASPYSHPDELVRHDRFAQALQATATMLRDGLIVYSPIVHCHPLARVYDLPTDFAFWQNYNFGILKHAEGLWVLMIDGFESSLGVQNEIIYAKELCIPYHYKLPEHFLW